MTEIDEPAPVGVTAPPAGCSWTRCGLEAQSLVSAGDIAVFGSTCADRRAHAKMFTMSLIEKIAAPVATSLFTVERCLASSGSAESSEGMAKGAEALTSRYGIPTFYVDGTGCYEARVLFDPCRA